MTIARGRFTIDVAYSQFELLVALIRDDHTEHRKRADRAPLPEDPPYVAEYAERAAVKADRLAELHLTLTGETIAEATEP